MGIRIPIHVRAFARYVLRLGGVFRLDGREILMLMEPSDIPRFYRAVQERREIWNFIGSGELFLAMGKVRLVHDVDRVFIVDAYLFYPTCTRSDVHFQGCACPDSEKRWEFFSKYISTPSILARLIKKMACFINIRITDASVDIHVCGLEFEFAIKTPSDRPQTLLQLTIDADFISVRISDWIFSKIGRPFITVAEIDLRMLKAAAVAAEEYLDSHCEDDMCEDDLF